MIKTKFRFNDMKKINRRDLETLIIDTISTDLLGIREVSDAINMNYNDTRLIMTNLAKNKLLEKVRGSKLTKYKRYNYCALADLYYPANKILKNFKINSIIKHKAYTENFSYPTNEYEYGFAGDIVSYEIKR